MTINQLEHSCARCVRSALIVLIAIVVATLLVSCSNPVDALTSRAEPGLSVTVPTGTTSARSLMADSLVASVDVTVLDEGGTSLGEWALTKAATAWTGTIDLGDQTGTFDFAAYARTGDGLLLWYGTTSRTIVGGDESVSISVTQDVPVEHRMTASYPNNTSAFVYAFFNTDATVYYQLGGVEPTADDLLLTGESVHFDYDETGVVSLSTETVAMRFGTLTSGTSYTVHYLADDGSTRTPVLSETFTTTSVDEVTLSGSVNLPDAWTINAYEGSGPIGYATVSGGVWSLPVESGSVDGYEAALVAVAPDDQRVRRLFAHDSVTVGTSSVSGIELEVALRLENGDPAFDGRTVRAYVYLVGSDPETGTPVAVAGPDGMSSEVTLASGQAIFPSIVDATTGTPWTGMPYFAYDYYFLIMPSDSGLTDAVWITNINDVAYVLMTDESGAPIPEVVDATDATYRPYTGE